MHIRDGRVVSNFIVQALRNEPITIYGEGSQTRSFCFVEDLIVGLVELMNSTEDVSGPVNFGNPEEVTMTSLAETIVELTNSESRIAKTSLPSDDPLRRNPDITKAKNLFDWAPNYTLRAGLVETIPYFRRELSTTTF
jgi:UDP-glucuronate decarboxylase